MFIAFLNIVLLYTLEFPPLYYVDLCIMCIAVVCGFVFCVFMRFSVWFCLCECVCVVELCVFLFLSVVSLYTVQASLLLYFCSYLSALCE